jgi:hypothetical protein
MRWTILGRLPALVMLTLALSGTARADRDLETTWRELFDASKLDEALTLARSSARDAKLPRIACWRAFWRQRPCSKCLPTRPSS